MSNKKIAIVTGSEGDIGKSIVKKLSKNDYLVIGIDNKSSDNNNLTINCDLRKIVNNLQFRKELYEKILDKIIDNRIHLLVNNAAIQIIGSFEELSIEHWKKSIDVNAIVPIILTKLFYENLKIAKGSVVNISSIHATQTKKKFSAYASSKSLLSGMTRALSVDIGKYVRINAIEPAAVNTKMLKDGISQTNLNLLKKSHPVERIGNPDDIADAVLFLSSDNSKFLNGACLNISGGIHNRLYDPE